MRRLVNARGVGVLVFAEAQGHLALEAEQLAVQLAALEARAVAGELAAGEEPERVALQARVTIANQRLTDLDWVLDSLAHFDTLWDVYQPSERAQLVAALVAEVRVSPNHTASLTWQPWFEKAARQ